MTSKIRVCWNHTHITNKFSVHAFNTRHSRKGGKSCTHSTCWCKQFLLFTLSFFPPFFNVFSVTFVEFLSHRIFLYKEIFTVNRNSYFCCLLFAFPLFFSPSFCRRSDKRKQEKINADRMTQWDEKIFAQYKNRENTQKDVAILQLETFLVSDFCCLFPPAKNGFIFHGASIFFVVDIC